MGLAPAAMLAEQPIPVKKVYRENRAVATVEYAQTAINS